MEKIKKSMRREDGFTLVELLAVIVILGIIMAIAVPAVGNLISKSKTNAKLADGQIMIDAARMYFTAEKNLETDTGDLVVTVIELVNEGYLEKMPDGLKADTTLEVRRSARTDETGSLYEYKIYTNAGEAGKESAEYNPKVTTPGT